mgnify:CR=1 FL=1
MVATAQLRTARRQVDESRVFAHPIMNSWALPETLTVQPDTSKGPEVWLAIATDRSLCGAVNARLLKQVRPLLEEAKLQDRKNLELFVLGEKGRSSLERDNKRFLSTVFTDLARCKELTFKQSLAYTDAVLKSNPSKGSIFYNHFVNAMSFETRRVSFVDLDTQVANTQFLSDHTYNRDHENYKNYYEAKLAATMFNFWAENVGSEISARMSAMSTSSKNAEDIAFVLNRFYNRQRQAKITSELIEINSGAQVIAEQGDQ